MKKYPYLKQAPIHEALVDIRVDLPPEFESKKFLTVQNQIKKLGFSTVEECWQFTTGIQFNQDKQSVSQKKVSNGYWFRTEDKSELVQFRKDGFTFNKLKPYSSWAEIQKTVKRVFPIYQELTAAKIIRLAVRYINHIDLSLPLKNISSYFSITPDVAGRGNRPLKGFMQRSVIQETEIDGESIVTFATIESPVPECIRILLDIDVNRRINDGQVLSGSQIWKNLNDCRNIKNRIFFNSLTMKAVNKYK